MSKPGVNMPPQRQNNNPFRKDNRSGGPNQGGPHHHHHDNKRNSGNFSAGHNHNQNQNNQNQNQNAGDKSANRNENKQNSQNQNVKKEENNTEKMDDKDVKTGEATEKKFTGRCRLFVGNLTPDITEDEFKKLFEPFGEISEVYVNTGRGFGFIRLDYRHNAEAAKAGLDGLVRKGRILRIRFATHGAALKVKNLHTYVSNELLEQSFSQFGDLERCIVIVDDRGKSTGEGIVEFVRKPGANSALRRITEGVFLMGADPKPVYVEPLEQKDEEDGMPEKFLTKTDQYKKEREKEPRFAPPGTFEYEFGMRWKQLEELEKQRIEQIKKDTEEARIKLEDEMQNALYEYQAEQIRQDLLRQQEELRRLEELRNADRLRRQEQLERRREVTDRQAEERRRADMMMNMRQQEIASRRGPIDGPGMRREEMMMADRFGDRMGERMGDRMGERMGDRMRERMPEGMGDRMRERMPEGMAERMGDRMPDRPMDHRNEQMGGMMWHDEKGREGAMRDDPQRGRDMRGSGAPPLQPPPVPPSGMGAMERGGPAGAAAAAAAAAAQNAKSSPGPKPLMGQGQPGFVGQQGGGAGGPNNPNAGPGAQMRQRGRFEGGNNEGGFQNQRGVLGSGPGGPMGGPQGGVLGNPATAAAAAAMAANQMRGGPGGMGGPGGSPNMFASQQERMLLERRREAAREELNDIKRMRRC